MTMVPENVLRNIPPTFEEWYESHGVLDPEEMMRLSEAALNLAENPAYKRVIGALEAKTARALVESPVMKDQGELLLMLQAVRLLREQIKALSVKAELKKKEDSDRYRPS